MKFTGLIRRVIGIASLAMLSMAAAEAADKTSTDGVWQLIDEVPAIKSAGQGYIRPETGQRVEINAPKLWDLLDSAPAEFSKAADKPAILTLPLPDGSFGRFAIVNSPIMEPELAEKFPEIRTFAGWGLDDPSASVRLDWTLQGFHAQILSPEGSIYIDPWTMNDPQYYTSYFKRDFKNKHDDRVCLVDPVEDAGKSQERARSAARTNGTQLRTYRIAVAATGEYTTYHGGTVALGQSAVVTAINRVSGIYERDLAIRLTLVANNNLLIYTNASTDPYSNNDANALLTQNQSNITSVIGSANYDVGHVFGTGGGGLAGLGVVCRSSVKARGETGSSNPVGDPFYVDYVAHEIGHQFGANHTYNGTLGNCGSNRERDASYEPGSGSTIMGYAGICGSDDLQSYSDAYFNFYSIDEILSYTLSGSGSNCPVTTATGNTPPTVNAGPDYSIPRGTPFTLTALAADANGDSLTYCWEQSDRGGNQGAQLNAADDGVMPLFRSFNPAASPSRTFPRLSNIINNISTNDEKLPQVSRASMDFICTVRDNRGGIADDSVSLNVVGTAGPFVVTYPNTNVTATGSITVTWNVAGTTAAPISTSAVRILLSADGGNTFPYTLSSNTANDGSETVALPAVNTASARVKVEAINNVYFDMSDANFTISAPVNVSYTGSTVVHDTGGNLNARLDPAEQNVHVRPRIQNIGGSPILGIYGTLTSNTPGITIVTSNAPYPDMNAGETGVPNWPFRVSAAETIPCGTMASFTLTITGGAGGTFSFQLPVGESDGSTESVVETYPASAGLPMNIPDGGTMSNPANSSVVVSNLFGTITKVRVTNVTITHTWSADLQLRLVSPEGTTVALAMDLGGSQDNVYTNTAFDDAASVVISSATAPFNGTFRPMQSLSAFNGQFSNGTWTLRVGDFAAQDVGQIVGWTLELTASVPGCADSTSAAYSELYE